MTGRNSALLLLAQSSRPCSLSLCMDRSSGGARRLATPARRSRKRVDLCLRPVGAPCSAGHPYAPRGGPVDCVALGNRPGQERLSPAGGPSPTPAHGRGAVPVVV